MAGNKKILPFFTRSFQILQMQLLLLTLINPAKQKRFYKFAAQLLTITLSYTC